MKSFEKLIAWQKAHELVLLTYKISSEFPADERFGLTSQLRRAVLSVPTNIAEGRARRATKDFQRFLYIARGSLEETEYLFIAARDLKYISENEYKILDALACETSAVLNGLINSINK